MVWFMLVLKIYKEQQLLLKYCVIKHSILPKIQIQRGLASMVRNFLDKRSASTSTHKESGINFENQQLAEELHIPIV